MIHVARPHAPSPFSLLPLLCFSHTLFLFLSSFILRIDCCHNGHTHPILHQDRRAILLTTKRDEGKWVTHIYIKVLLL